MTDLTNETVATTALTKKIAECEKCFPEFGTRLTKVNSMKRGLSTAIVMVVGEAPGNTEVETGEAFSGKAGMRLKTWLAQAGVSEDEIENQFYFTSLLKCACKGSIRNKMVGNCASILNAQIALVSPKLVVLLGSYPLRILLGYMGKLTSVIGNSYRETQLSPNLFKRFADNTVFVPLPHPSPISAWPQQNKDRLEEALRELGKNFEECKA